MIAVYGTLVHCITYHLTGIFLHAGISSKILSERTTGSQPRAFLEPQKTSKMVIESQILRHEDGSMGLHNNLWNHLQSWAPEKLLLTWMQVHSSTLVQLGWFVRFTGLKYLMYNCKNTPSMYKTFPWPFRRGPTIRSLADLWSPWLLPPSTVVLPCHAVNKPPNESLFSPRPKRIPEEVSHEPLPWENNTCKLGGGDVETDRTLTCLLAKSVIGTKCHTRTRTWLIDCVCPCSAVAAQKNGLVSLVSSAGILKKMVHDIDHCAAIQTPSRSPRFDGGFVAGVLCLLKRLLDPQTNTDQGS